jgi:hypothetical protein
MALAINDIKRSLKFYGIKEPFASFIRIVLSNSYQYENPENPK